MDHTFKVAANVGMVKDGKWFQLYDCLFLVLTETGLVKQFKFTKGTSFEKGDTLFLQLSAENPSPEFIFVDNCCNVKNILHNAFPNALIKLDLFHAVKRLTQYMPKRHLFYAEAVKSIGLVFRDSSDLFQRRMMSTPSSDVILQNRR